MYGVSERTVGNNLDIYEIDVVKEEATKMEVVATFPGDLANGIRVGGASRIPFSISSSAFYMAGINASEGSFRFQLWKIDINRLSMHLSRNIFKALDVPYGIGDITVTTNGEQFIVFAEDPTTEFDKAEVIYVCGRRAT